MKRARIVLLIPVVAMLGGCVVAAVAAVAGGGVVWVKGEARKTYPQDVATTHAAAVNVLKDMGVDAYTSRVDATAGVLEGRLADGKVLKMHFAAVGDGATEVKLRIGTWGDRERSSFIFAKIDSKLR